VLLCSFFFNTATLYLVCFVETTCYGEKKKGLVKLYCTRSARFFFWKGLNIPSGYIGTNIQLNQQLFSFFFKD
jgi:hypothetical protein